MVEQGRGGHAGVGARRVRAARVARAHHHRGRRGGELNAPHRIRIIGGRWKRTPVTVVDSPGLRPTPDRVRETLYNWIGPAIEGLRALDLFGGTGALGFEAASRGAAEVVIVERDGKALAALRALKAKLAADQVRLMAADALAALRQLEREPGRFDLVLLDPPFNERRLPAVVPALETLLAPQAWLYLEAESEILTEHVSAWLPNRNVEAARRGRAGQVYYHLFEIRT